MGSQEGPQTRDGSVSGDNVTKRKMQSTTRSEIRHAVRAMVSQTRYPRLILTVVVILIWVVLDRLEPFRSNFWLTLLGSGLSAIIAGLIIYWLYRRQPGSP